jgi:hypothetical protein
MREIGGKTSRLVPPSPSSAFFRGFFLSMRETRSTSWRGAEAVSGVTFGLTGCGVWAFSAAAEPVSAFSFLVETLGFAAAIGFWAASALRAAGLRVAVLLLVFVAIAVSLKFRSWPERLNQSHITGRAPAGAPPRESLAPSSRQPREYLPNPAHRRHAIPPDS